MKKTILLFAVLAFFVTKSNSQTVTDYDGNIYNTVTIGTQVWLKENLKVTHYRNGDSIVNITNYLQWRQMTSAAYCDYDNNPDTSKTYGRLYNWYVVNDSRNLAPIGWHIPTEPEWTTLIDYLGGLYKAGGKLKESGTTHWLSPNTGATNSSSFSALPSGFRRNDGSYCNLGHNGLMFCNAIDSTTFSYYITMSHLSLEVGIQRNNYKCEGYAVRCVRDIPAQIDEIIYQGDIKINPNPAIDNINIICASRQSLKMQLYNTVGQCVLQIELNKQTNTIDISSLTSGIYILKLTSPNGTIEKKIIKE
jgi:uncharacterized protein (TIGR02145 family)